MITLKESLLNNVDNIDEISDDIINNVTNTRQLKEIGFDSFIEAGGKYDHKTRTISLKDPDKGIAILPSVHGYYRINEDEEVLLIATQRDSNGTMRQVDGNYVGLSKCKKLGLTFDVTNIRICNMKELCWTKFKLSDISLTNTYHNISIDCYGRINPPKIANMINSTDNTDTIYLYNLGKESIPQFTNCRTLIVDPNWSSIKDESFISGIKCKNLVISNIVGMKGFNARCMNDFINYLESNNREQLRSTYTSSTLKNIDFLYDKCKTMVANNPNSNVYITVFGGDTLFECSLKNDELLSKHIPYPKKWS